MTTKKLKKFFEDKDFNVYLIKQDNVQGAEIETWTDGGVNMIFYLEPFSIESFKERVNVFNVDEEIDLHRQGQDYKNAFTIRESVEDFENFHSRLKDTLSELLNK